MNISDLRESIINLEYLITLVKNPVERAEWEFIKAQIQEQLKRQTRAASQNT